MGVKEIRPVGTIDEAFSLRSCIKVNAKAVATYIMIRQPEIVSLVCMGKEGIKPAVEDELCAAYIKSILEEREFPDFEQKVSDLRIHGGAHFFDQYRQHIFPEADFWMCIDYDRFTFVIKMEEDESGFITRKESVKIKL